MPDLSAPPLIPPSKPIPVDLSAAASSSPGVWDRITTWASEHKAVVYTVAGVAVVVTGAGVVYYLQNSVRARPKSHYVLLRISRDLLTTSFFPSSRQTRTRHKSSAKRSAGSARRRNGRGQIQKTPPQPRQNLQAVHPRPRKRQLSSPSTTSWPSMKPPSPRSARSAAQKWRWT
jgi:hypothetical protein